MNKQEQIEELKEAMKTLFSVAQYCDIGYSEDLEDAAHMISSIIDDMYDSERNPFEEDEND